LPGVSVLIAGDFSNPTNSLCFFTLVAWINLNEGTGNQGAQSRNSARAQPREINPKPRIFRMELFRLFEHFGGHHDARQILI